jgi:hypothetical protein
LYLVLSRGCVKLNAVKVVGLKRRLSLQTGFDRSVDKWFGGQTMTDR